MRFLRGVVRALRPKSRELPGELESIIDYEFKDRALLSLAMTHRSRGGRHDSNERLELLGDAVLGLVAVEHLLEQFPREDEGALTKRRSYLVSRGFLAKRARRLGLHRFMRLGRGEDTVALRGLPSVGADTMEALIGAVYTDGGLDAARRVVLKVVLTKDAMDGWEGSDPKSALQELVQRSGGSPPTYVVVGERGPHHRKTFEVEVRVAGACWGRGTGRSKKQAQRAAAAAALEHRSGV
jgi:ribonuclease-3